MTTFDRIKNLANKQGKSLQKVASDLGFSPSYFYNLKSKKSPSAEHLAKVADYFHVSVDYLLGREELTSIKEPVDLADLVDDSKVDWDEWVSFDGKPLTDEVKTAMKLILGKRLED
ncbi:helix-turn-helix domain-containing protein [Pseudolactococcus raffinolactis]|uniref:helix-turn-helix domain-containing protein n=1 Tax=Pseudolactococcus raffinolactis TaxID=1366 RepID=UPI0014373436|nr:helix-turn-helix domain-containing protein [Lactococcus raffinolactis]QIW56416.1 helix-turn-helix domain-containing protein [Lactococcus raffinolactis]